MAVPARFGDEFRLNTTTALDEFAPSIAALANGKFVAVWQQDTATNSVITGQLFNADGSKLGTEFTIASGGGTDKGEPSVAARPDGSFAVAWTEDGGAAPLGDGSGESINARLYNVDGSAQGAAFRVNTTQTTNDQFHPQIAAGHDGSFVITWQSTISMTDSDVWAQYFGTNGAAVGSNFTLNSNADFQGLPTVTSLKNGNYVVAWTDQGNADGSDSYIGGEIFSKNGTVVKAPFVLNSPTLGGQTAPSLAGLNDGTFVAVWQDLDGGGGGDIQMQRFTAAGVAIPGSDVAVKADPVYYEGNPVVTATSSGFAVTWFDDDTLTTSDTTFGHIGVKLFNTDGTAASDAFVGNQEVTAGEQSGSKVVELGDHRILVTWTDPGDDLTQSDNGSDSVRGQIFDPRTKAVDLTGSKLGDDYIGTKFGDTMAGAKGADMLVGAAGKDHLGGGKGDDTLKGDAGADHLNGGKGVDALYAGDDDKKDVFEFTSKHDSGNGKKDTWDKLFDFDAAGKHEKVSDKIDLSAIDADKGQKHDQDFRFVDQFSKATGDEANGQVRVDDSGKGVKVLVDVNGDNDADMIFLVKHVQHLHESDFIL